MEKPENIIVNYKRIDCEAMANSLSTFLYVNRGCVETHVKYIERYYPFIYDMYNNKTYTYIWIK